MASPDSIETLVARARNGDRGAFELLVVQPQDRLLASIRAHKLKAAQPETDTPFGKKDHAGYFERIAAARRRFRRPPARPLDEGDSPRYQALELDARAGSTEKDPGRSPGRTSTHSGRRCTR